MIDYDSHINENSDLIGATSNVYWRYDARTEVVQLSCAPPVAVPLGLQVSDWFPREALHDLRERAALSRAFGIEQTIFFPSAALHMYDIVQTGTVEEIDFCLSYERAFCREWRSEEIRPVRLLPGHPVTAREVLRSSVDLEQQPIWLLPVRPAVPYLALDVWSPVFDAMDDAIVTFHLRYGMQAMAAPQHPLATIMFMRAEVQAAATAVLLSGLLIRFPKIRLLVTECEVSWFTDLVETADSSTGIVGLEHACIDLNTITRRNQVMISVPSWERAGQSSVVVLGTDMPHRDGWKPSREQRAAIR